MFERDASEIRFSPLNNEEGPRTYVAQVRKGLLRRFSPLNNEEGPRTPMEQTWKRYAVRSVSFSPLNNEEGPRT